MQFGLSCDRVHDRLYMCPQEARLVEVWDDATQWFSLAAAELTANSDKLGTPEYERLRSNLEKARLAADNAREFLNIHRHEHGCGDVAVERREKPISARGSTADTSIKRRRKRVQYALTFFFAALIFVTTRHRYAVASISPG